MPDFMRQIKPPKFIEYQISPPRYLEELESYLKTFKIKSWKLKLLCINFEHHLSDFSWQSQINLNTLGSYDNFKRKFLKTFWSSAERKTYKKLIFEEEFHSSNKSENLYRFGKRQFAIADRLYPNLSLRKSIRKFADLLPSDLALCIMIKKFKSLEHLFAHIKQIDQCKPIMDKNKTVKNEISSEKVEFPIDVKMNENSRDIEKCDSAVIKAVDQVSEVKQKRKRTRQSRFQN